MEHLILRDYKRPDFNGMHEELNTMFSQSAKSNLLLGYYAGTFLGLSFHDTLDQIKDDPDTEELSLFMKNCLRDGEDHASAMMSMIEYVYLVQEWKHKKQIFKFDEHLIEELADTETDIFIPYEIFSRLQYQTIYLDFSSNRELCDKIQTDGCIVKPSRVVTLVDGVAHIYFVLLISVYYKGQSKSVRGITIPDEQDGINLSSDDLCPELNEVVDYAKLQTAVIMQSILYLCSYEPDIRETDVSKARKRQAKKSKSSVKPETEYEVGIRFGAAFRKWTAGKLGSDAEHTGTGSKKRPHVRRAHWHRFWVGKRDSDDRKLIIKWISECFCGMEAGEIDKLSAVQHKVS